MVKWYINDSSWNSSPTLSGLFAMVWRESALKMNSTELLTKELKNTLYNGRINFQQSDTTSYFCTWVMSNSIYNANLDFFLFDFDHSDI